MDFPNRPEAQSQASRKLNVVQMPWLFLAFPKAGEAYAVRIPAGIAADCQTVAPRPIATLRLLLSTARTDISRIAPVTVQRRQLVDCIAKTPQVSRIDKARGTPKDAAGQSMLGSANGKETCAACRHRPRCRRQGCDPDGCA